MAATAQLNVLPSPKYSGQFEPEFNLLLACCRPTRQRQAIHLPTSFDYARFLDSAEHHRLIPALRGAFVLEPYGIASALRDRARAHACRAMRFTAELARIARHFELRGIEFLAYKGPALAYMLYGDVTMRQFGDLDLLVRSRDVPRARTALVQLGYDPQLSLSRVEENSYLRTGYEYAFGIGVEAHVLELQWRIMPRFYSIDFDIDELFARSTRIQLDDVAMRTPGPEDLMLLLCAHAAKHEWSELAMLRDIAALAQFELSWSSIAEKGRRLGITKIVEISLLAVRELFGLELPHATQLGVGKTDASQLVSTILHNLRRNRGPDTESLQYFRRQTQLRERWRDRLTFGWRLATTPSIAEWEMVKLPDGFFSLYRGVRVARLIKRSFAAGLKRN